MTVLHFVLVVSTSSLDMCNLPKFPHRPPIPRAEQFLHRALFELPFLGDKLFHGFDNGIRIAQRLGDGFLFSLVGGIATTRVSKVTDIEVLFVQVHPDCEKTWYLPKDELIHAQRNLELTRS